LFENTRFKEVREENRYTQKEFAKILNLKSWQTCKSIETFKQKISIDMATKIEDEFNINLRWLLTGRGAKYLNEDTSSVNVNNHNGNVAVNGTITINTKDYADSQEIKELLDILKDVPKSWIDKVLKKLKKALTAIDEEF
jgi:DNA-binding XRE family transcriptional regulator